MNTIYRYGALSALILGIASGCSSDNDGAAPPAHAGAAGQAGGAGMSGDAGSADVGGSPGAAGEVGEGAGEGGTGGALESDGGAGGDLAAGDGGVGGALPDPLAASTVLDVNAVKTNPAPYDWFDFKPNVKKLILAGAAETEHIAILWYTVTDGGVGLHYHPKTESVYVIDGTQTDAKGVYTNGTVYFNPPGSGHQITGSSGFFLLAYAAPPDFANTDLIEAYSPVRIAATAPDLTTSYEFTERGEGIKTYAVPLAETGGLSAELLETTSAAPFTYHGNYLLVLAGSCNIEGVTLGQGMLVVAKTVDPRNYRVSASTASTCRTLGVSFD